jgi:hypothetical protein
VDFAREEFKRNRDVKDLVCFVLSQLWREGGIGTNRDCMVDAD